MTTQELIEICTKRIEEDGEGARVALCTIKSKEPATDTVTLFPYGVARGGPKGTFIRAEEHQGRYFRVWGMFSAKEVLDFLYSP